jgi:hypothetical protein
MRRPRQKLLDRHSGFETCELRTDTQVNAVAEA